jgi:hypothetical protein
MSHVQVDEYDKRDLSIYQKVEHALQKFRSNNILINIEPTKEMVAGVSRPGFCRVGSDELHEIDDALRREIAKRMGTKTKGILNLACDAMIALSSLNHDYFVTSDIYLFQAWKTVIENNQEYKKKLKAQYTVPKIVLRKKPKGILQTILKSS